MSGGWGGGSLKLIYSCVLKTFPEPFRGREPNKSRDKENEVLILFKSRLAIPGRKNYVWREGCHRVCAICWEAAYLVIDSNHILHEMQVEEALFM